MTAHLHHFYADFVYAPNISIILSIVYHAGPALIFALRHYGRLEFIYLSTTTNPLLLFARHWSFNVIHWRHCRSRTILKTNVIFRRTAYGPQDLYRHRTMPSAHTTFAQIGMKISLQLTMLWIMKAKWMPTISPALTPLKMVHRICLPPSPKGTH